MATSDTLRYLVSGVTVAGLLAMIGAALAIGPLSLGVRPHDVPPLALAAAAVGALFGAPAFAAEKIDYSPSAFDAALKDGKSILVEIHAPWCPTCKAQKPILAEIEAKPAYKDLVVVHVDFDSQKDAVRRFGARMQSTSSRSRTARRRAGPSARRTRPRSPPWSPRRTDAR